MDDIKVLFSKEGENGKDDGAGYHEGNTSPNIFALNRRHSIVLDSGQVNSLDSVRQKRNLMVFTNPLKQANVHSSWACFRSNIGCNESNLQTYLRNVPLAQGLSA